MYSAFRQKSTRFKKILSLVVVCTFVFSSLTAPSNLYAQNFLNLPTPGTMVSPSQSFNPASIVGLVIHPENPLQFDFIIDTGDDRLEGESLENESSKLINYFLAALTVPEEDLWVNLSPYEKDRIIPEGLSHTEMGRDMLAQDYLLKQLSASMLYPEGDFGRKFWSKVRQKAQEKFGTEEIPTDMFHKIWIVPEKATIYVNENTIYVVSHHLNVMLEEDYLAMEVNAGRDNHGLGQVLAEDMTQMKDSSLEIIREVLLPEIEYEINHGKHFANLRQIFNSMILASWYKRNLKNELLEQLYINQNKIDGIESQETDVKEKIYQRYLQAFEKGVYNYVKEEINPKTNEVIPRKYFSGGVAAAKVGQRTVQKSGEAPEELIRRGAGDFAMVSMRAEPIKDRAMLEIADPYYAEMIRSSREHEKTVVTDSSAEIMLNTDDRTAMLAHAKGGLGFLQMDQLGNYMELGGEEFNTFGVFPGYENNVDPEARLRQKVDYSGNGVMQPFMVRNEQGEEEHLKFNVNFRGIDGQGVAHPLGKEYEVEIFTINHRGTPLFFIRQPEINDHLYPGNPFSDNQVQQFAFFARAYVELMKKLDLSPDITRISEGHMVFVPAAIQNDIKHHEENGEVSIFSRRPVVASHFQNIVEDEDKLLQQLIQLGLVDKKGKKLPKLQSIQSAEQLDLDESYSTTLKSVILKELKRSRNTVILPTTHTPEAAAVIKLYGENAIDHLKRVAGWDEIIPEMLYTDENGVLVFNVIDALYNMADAMNSVSPEHQFVSEEAGIYPARELSTRKTVPIANGSDQLNFTEPEALKTIQQIIKDHGNEGLLNPELLSDEEVQQTHVRSAQQFNERLRGEGREILDPELIADRPIFSSFHRLVPYKQQDLLLPLIDWIVGERDQNFTVTRENPYLPVGFELGPGLGGLLAVGGPAFGEGVEWTKQFDSIKARLSVQYGANKGRLATIWQTGTDLMREGAGAGSFWIHTSYPTREASGTGHHRAQMNGGRVIATYGAGHSVSLTNKSGQLIEVLTDLPFEAVVQAFQQPENNYEILMRQKREMAEELVKGLRRFSDEFYAWKEDGDQTHMNASRLSMKEFYDTASAKVFVPKYFDLFESVLESVDTKTNVADLFNSKQSIRVALQKLPKDRIGQLLSPEQKQSIRLDRFDLSNEERWHQQLVNLRTEALIQDNLTQTERASLLAQIGREESFLREAASQDNAMFTKGGIDFNPNMIEFETQGGTIEFDFPDNYSELLDVNIKGIQPVIIQMTPMTNLPLRLGVREEEEDSFDLSRMN